MPSDDQLRLLPIRQPLVPLAGEVPLFPADGVVDWLSRPEKYLVLASGGAGEICAGSETALAEAQAVVRMAHGNRVCYGAPTIHTYVDAATGAVMEPVLFLRLDVPKAFGAYFLDDLRKRCVQVQEMDLHGQRAVLRAEGRLATLFGYERAVLSLTDGSAHVLSWLMRYAPRSAAAADPSTTR